MPAGSGLFAWAYTVRLRTKNPSGTVLKTYKPNSTTYRTPSPPVPEDDIEEITLVTGADGSVVKGFFLIVTWNPLSIGGSFAGDTGYDSLEDVLNSARSKTSGVQNTLELSLDGGTTYRPVFLRSDSGSKRFGRINNALEREMEFKTRAYVSAEVAPSGSAW